MRKKTGEAERLVFFMIRQRAGCRGRHSWRGCDKAPVPERLLRSLPRLAVVKGAL